MSQHELLIINQGIPLSAKDIDYLQRKGYWVNSSNDTESFKDILAPPNEPIIVVNCSEQEETTEFIQGICEQKSLIPFPVVVLAKNLMGLDSLLNKIFPLAIAVQQPADANKITEAVRFIERNYSSSILEHAAKNKLKESNFEEEEKELGANEVTDKIKHSNELFLAVKDCHLSQNNLGGTDLPQILSGRIFSKVSKDYKTSLPQDLVLEEACASLLLQVKSATRSALERVNIITMKILTPLNIETEVMELARAASILFAQSFAVSNRVFLTQDYSFRGAVVLRKEICSAIKDSALDLGGDLSNRDLSRVVANIAKIVGHESSGGDNQISVCASAVVAADLINRLCYQSLYWNASAAYRLLRRIRQGKIKHLHPAVCCIVLKLLAEALSGHINVRIMAPKKSQEEKESLEMSIRIHDETIVELPELMAGMKLSRPLLAEDGKAILAEDLVLDDDLIMRIWQLSAIKLIDKAVIKRVH